MALTLCLTYFLVSSIINYSHIEKDDDMTKKIRLIDEPETVSETPETETQNNEQLMKYLEAIDWKLWELLKLARKVAGE